MDEDAPHTMRWPRVFARVAGYMILGVGLYALSFGPATYVFAYRSTKLDRAFGLFYEPLFRTIWGTDLRHHFVSYLDWWYELPGGPMARLLKKSTLLPAVNDPGPAQPIP